MLKKLLTTAVVVVLVVAVSGYEGDDELPGLPEGIHTKDEFMKWVSQGHSVQRTAVARTTIREKLPGRNSLGEKLYRVYNSFKDIDVNFKCFCENFDCGCGVTLSFTNPPTTHHAILGIRPLENCRGEVSGLEAYLNLIDSTNHTETITLTLLPVSSVCQGIQNISACIEPYGFKLHTFRTWEGKTLRMCAQLNIQYEDIKIYSLDLDCFFLNMKGHLAWDAPEENERPDKGLVNELVDFFKDPANEMRKFFINFAESGVKVVGEYLAKTHKAVVEWVTNAAETVGDAVETAVNGVKNAVNNAASEVKNWWNSWSLGKRRRRRQVSMCHV